MPENEKMNEKPEHVDETPAVEAQQDTEQAETFPREYVEKLRTEAADARTRAKRVDELAAENWRLKAQLDGRLADASDLPYQADVDVAEAITALLEAKPHLAARRIQGSVGQGEVGKTPAPQVSLMGLLR